MYSKEIKVLDHGFVRYVDHMGSDQRIVEAARISYKSPSKGEEQDKKLIEYLYKNKHCYHPSMEVLTVEGWKQWSECKKKEKFLVPNPENNKLIIEELDVLSFDCNEEIHCFKNSRMSYKVTQGHRMFFKPKLEKSFEIFKVEDMSKWGNFKPLNNFTIEVDDLSPNDELQYVGFFLGDGSCGSQNTIRFNLKKQRKIKYLKYLCDILGFKTKERKTSNNSIVTTVYGSEELLNKYINRYKTARNKSFDYPLDQMTHSELSGLYLGLVNSDGSIKQDRPQTEFSSASYSLINLFDALGAYLGYPTHRTNTGVCSFTGTRTSLEARKQYFYKEKYSGLVYCATTSTGLLCVRGSNKEHGFICGNTSPFEMCKVTLNIKMPIFVMRQYVRHRMQNLNEVSARYTELPDEFYIPTEWRRQDTKNKQGSVADYEEDWTYLTPLALQATDALKRQCNQAYEVYQRMIETGIAREMARMVLPVNIYTECYACWDLKNLLHFITLRDDSHAQAEIQEYGKAIKQILIDLFPVTMECYEKFKWKLVE